VDQRFDAAGSRLCIGVEEQQVTPSCLCGTDVRGMGEPGVGVQRDQPDLLEPGQRRLGSVRRAVVDHDDLGRELGRTRR
jgi:hypothetical protein